MLRLTVLLVERK